MTTTATLTCTAHTWCVKDHHNEPAPLSHEGIKATIVDSDMPAREHRVTLTAIDDEPAPLLLISGGDLYLDADKTQRYADELADRAAVMRAAEYAAARR